MVRYNEYHPNGLTPATGTLLSRKLSNQIKKLRPDLTIKLKNVAVNGMKMGCSGFVIDPDTNNTVYVNTDHNHGLNMGDAYYRVARDERDFSGGRNHRASYEDLAREIVNMLDNFPAHEMSR